MFDVDPMDGLEVDGLDAAEFLSLLACLAEDEANDREGAENLSTGIPGVPCPSTGGEGVPAPKVFKASGVSEAVKRQAKRQAEMRDSRDRHKS